MYRNTKNNQFFSVTEEVKLMPQKRKIEKTGTGIKTFTPNKL